MIRQYWMSLGVMTAFAMALAGCEDHGSSTDQSGTYEALVMNDTAESIQIEYTGIGVVLHVNHTSTIKAHRNENIDLWFNASGIGSVTVTQGNNRRTFRRPVEHPVFAINQDNMK